MNQEPGPARSRQRLPGRLSPGPPSCAAAVWPSGACPGGTAGNGKPHWTECGSWYPGQWVSVIPLTIFSQRQTIGSRTE